MLCNFICTVAFYVMERYLAYGDDSLRECEVDSMSKLIEPHLVKLHNYDAQLC